jgi:hypothetical protein
LGSFCFLKRAWMESPNLFLESGPGKLQTHRRPPGKAHSPPPPPPPPFPARFGPSAPAPGLAVMLPAAEPHRVGPGVWLKIPIRGHRSWAEVFGQPCECYNVFGLIWLLKF